jgi:hypothetical protein
MNDPSSAFVLPPSNRRPRTLGEVSALGHQSEFGKMHASASRQRGYFTLFDAFEVSGLILGGILGGEYGYANFGYIGGVVGLLVGGFAGLIILRLPFALSLLFMRRNLEKSSSQKLRERLHNGEYYIAHHIIPQLLVQGEDVSDEIPLFIDWMKAETEFCRRCGWVSLKLVLPEIPSCVDEYNPMDSTEKCRELALRIADSIEKPEKMEK